MLKIYLIRHAESLGNKKGINLGSDIDLRLSPRGKEQVQKLADYLRNKKITEIYSSDLKRASETAEIIAQKFNLPVKKTELLREMKIGKWAGEKNVPEKWIKYYNQEKEKGIPRKEIRPLGGENSWDHMKHVKKFISSIKNREGNILVVAHSGTNKVFLGILEGKDPDDFYGIKQDSACINKVEFDGKKWKVLKINQTAG